MTEVFINNQKLELPSQQITQTFQVNDIKNIGNRQTSFTNNFNVPKTANNIRIFDYVGLVGNNRNNSHTAFPLGNPTADIVVGGFGIVTRGYAILNETTDSYYKITIYGAEKTFFEDSKTATLKDAFPSTTFDYYASVVFDAMKGNREDIIFCFLYYNPLSDSRGITFREPGNESNQPGFNRYDEFYIEKEEFRFYTTRMTPQFHAKYLFDKAIEYLGYTYEFENGAGFPSDFDDLLLSAGSYVTAKNISYGDTVDLKDFAPTMTIRDFILEIAMRYGLVFQIDEVNKKVMMTTYKGLLSTNNQVDWSEKFEIMQSESYSYGKDKTDVQYFEYNKDDDNELRGEIVLDDRRRTEKTIFKSKFEYPTDSGYLVKIREDGRDWKLERGIDLGEYISDEDDPETIKTHIKPKTLLFHKGRITPEYEPTFAFIYSRSDSDYNYYRYEDNSFYYSAYNISSVIGFSAYLENNYSEYIELLKHRTIIKVKIRLNLLDVYQLNFLRKVYIKQLGAEFLINKISNFKVGKLSDVELVEIPKSILE